MSLGKSFCSSTSSSVLGGSYLCKVCLAQAVLLRLVFLSFCLSDPALLFFPFLCPSRILAHCSQCKFLTRLFTSSLKCNARCCRPRSCAWRRGCREDTGCFCLPALRALATSLRLGCVVTTKKSSNLIRGRLQCPTRRRTQCPTRRR